MTWQFLAAGSSIPAAVLLTWLIQSTVLLAIGLLAGHVLRRRGPAVQSALYRTTLGAVILCPVASVALAVMGFQGLQIQLPTVSENKNNHAEEFRAKNKLIIGGIEARSQRADTLSTQTRHSLAGPPVPSSLPNPAGEAGAAAAVAARVQRQTDVSPRWVALIDFCSVLLVTVWLLGTTVLGTRLYIGHRLMARLRSAANDAELDVVVLCGDLARRMRLNPPLVMRSPFLCSPCLDGVRRPAILLPEDADENLRDMFIHELAHLQRRDGLWNLLRHSATAVFWILPLIWLLSKRLEATAEEVCDDVVVEFGADRCNYASHLLELAKRHLPPVAPVGVGMISLRSLLARRITRILDSTRMLSTKAGRRAIAVTLLAGLAGTLLVGLLGVGGGNRTVIEAEPKVGKASREKPTPRKVTPAMNPASTMPITGRIVDLEGRPVAGVTVQVTQITKPTGDDLGPWIEAVKRGEASWIAYRQLIYAPPIVPEEKRPTATTDTQGRFGFDGLASERLVELTIQGPTIAYTHLKVVTRQIEPIPARGFLSSYGPAFETVYPPEFTFIATPGRAVDGIVRDAKSKQPMAGVGIRSLKFAGANVFGVPDLKTTTDDQGKFRLIGFPKGVGNQFLVIPNDDHPYFMQEVTVADPPGIAPVPVVINLNKGIWIEGKVTDNETGKPVPGSLLHYIPFLDNTFAQATPEFRKDRGVDGFDYQERYQTKEDGTYRLVGLPGRAIVGVNVISQKSYLRGAGFESIFGADHKGIPPTYFNPVSISRYFPYSMKKISPPEGVEVVHLDLELYPGARVRLRIVDLEGKPVAGVTAAGRTGRGEPFREPIQDAEFDVLTLAPGEDRIVVVRHVERKLGKLVHVHEGQDKNGSVTVILEPLATIRGTVVDANGKPVSGAIVRTDPWPHTSGGFSLSLGHIASDHAGEFVVPDVPAGSDYNLAFQQNSTVKAANQTIFREAKVRPGETTELGEIRFNVE